MNGIYVTAGAGRAASRRVARAARLTAMGALACALIWLAGGYCARYAALERAAGGAQASYHALIYGGAAPEGMFERLSGSLPAGAALLRGADGAVYGYASAASAWECALSEMRLRGALGAWARADRWTVAVGATRAQPGRAIPIDRAWGAQAGAGQAVERLMRACGDEAATGYRDGVSASARGARCHAAARAGSEIEYMLADGYLPVDY